MTAPLKIVAPGFVRGKGRPRFNRGTGAAYTPEITARFENLVALAAAQAMVGRKLFEGPLTVLIEAYMMVKPSWSQKQRSLALVGAELPTGKPDADNVAKMLDALNGVVWIDDSQIVDWRVLKIYAEVPRLEVTVASYFS